jgi:transposase InsO family protein
VLPKRGDRLLHPRDAGLGLGSALPRRGGDRGHRSGRGWPWDRAGAARARHRQRNRLHVSGFRARLEDLGITHPRGGYRDPESQAFIESFFSKLKERVVWRNEFETLDQARAVIGNYIDNEYPNRPHSRLGYRTPLEVRQSWEDPFRLQKDAA